MTTILKTERMIAIIRGRVVGASNIAKPTNIAMMKPKFTAKSMKTLSDPLAFPASSYPSGITLGSDLALFFLGAFGALLSLRFFDAFS